MKIKFKRSSRQARIPIRGIVTSAGYDLFSAQDIERKPNSAQIIPIGIGLKIPKNFIMEGPVLALVGC